MVRRTWLAGLLAISAWALGASAAQGDEAPPPTPAATPAPSAEPAPVAPPAEPKQEAPAKAPAPPAAVPTPPPPSIPCPPPCDDVAQCCSRWTLTVLGSAARLTDDPSGPLGEPVGAGPHQVSWDSLSYDCAAGGSIALSMECACSTLTARGTYYGKFDDSASDAGVYGGRQSPGAQVIPSLPFLADLSEEGTLWGAEIEWTRSFGCRCGWTLEGGVGLRLLHFSEKARANLSPAPPATAGLSPSVSADARSVFVGPELVGIVRRSLSPCFEVGLEVRAFGGWMNRHADVEDSDVFSGGTHSANDRSNDFAFGGEADLTASWHISRRLSLVLGGGVLLLTNVQRAHRAMDFANASSGQVGAVSDDTDSILVERVFAGFSLEL